MPSLSHYHFFSLQATLLHFSFHLYSWRPSASFFFFIHLPHFHFPCAHAPISFYVSLHTWIQNTFVSHIPPFSLRCPFSVSYLLLLVIVVMYLPSFFPSFSSMFACHMVSSQAPFHIFPLLNFQLFLSFPIIYFLTLSLSLFLIYFSWVSPPFYFLPIFLNSIFRSFWFIFLGESLVCFSFPFS